MTIDLKKEIAIALKEAAKPVDANFLSSLKASDYDHFFLKVTETALAKNIFDANKEIRGLFKKLCIHEYDAQDHGKESMVEVPGFFGLGKESLSIHLYRAEKRGDRRISISNIKKYAEEGDTLVIIIMKKVFYVFNTNNKKLDKSLSFIERMVTPLPTETGDIQTDNMDTEPSISLPPTLKKVPDKPERPESERIKIKLGIDPSNRNQSIVWDPFNPAKSLTNSHMAVLGASGVGKTQTMKVITRELSSFGVKPIIIDFNQDFVGSNFTQSVGAEIHNAETGINFNPLAIPKNKNPLFQSYQIAAVLGKIFNLGTQQQANLKNAIMKTYESNEINSETCVNDDTGFPSFGELEEFIEETNDTKLLNRIKVLFDFNLFQGQVGFQEGFLNKGHVFNLNDKLPDEETKKSVAAMILMGTYNTLLGLSHSPRNIRLAIMVDEAHKVANLKEMQTLLKEGRKYGCAVFLSSQEATDFETSVYSNVGSCLCLKLPETDNSVMMAKQIGSYSTHKTLAEDIRNLPPFEGLFKNDHYNKSFAKIKIENYFERFGNWGND